MNKKSEKNEVISTAMQVSASLTKDKRKKPDANTSHSKNGCVQELFEILQHKERRKNLTNKLKCKYELCSAFICKTQTKCVCLDCSGKTVNEKNTI